MNPLKSKSECGTSCQTLSYSGKHADANLYAQIKDFFSHIFDTSSWPPRWHCGTWSDFHGWLYILSDLAIGVSYFAIPILLLRILSKKKDLPFTNILGLFIGFILLCGTTHLLDALIFYWPAYRLSAIVRFATGIISIVTVFSLTRILPLIHKLRTQDQLEAEIKERENAEQEARNLQIMKDAAEELMHKRDEFMMIASHELKTPTTIVKASLQILELMIKKDEKLLEVEPLISKASKQVNKLTRLINDLMDVTKIQSGSFELEMSDFNLKLMIEDCVEQSLSINLKHTVRIDGKSDFLVHGDRNRLEQVLSNLLSNAFKYSPESSPVWVSTQVLENKKVKITVRDEGVGIAENKISYLFDRFYRVEDTAQYVSGVGLGLYISSEIIKKHNGEIGVVSELGKGSAFWFII